MLKYVVVQLPATVLGAIGAWLLLMSAHMTETGATYEPHYVYLGTMTLVFGVVTTGVLAAGCVMMDFFGWMGRRKSTAAFLKETGMRAGDEKARGA